MSKRILSVKEIIKLEKKHFRDELGIFVIEGKKIMSEAVAQHLAIEQTIVTEKFLRDQRDFLHQMGWSERDLTVISEQNAGRIAGTVTPAGIFAVIKKPPVSLSDLTRHSFIAVFENIRDPGNLGTMIRTADWFGVKAIMVSATGTDPYNDKVIRSTMGSVFHVQIYSSHNVLDDLQKIKKAGYAIVVTRPEVQENFRAGQQKTCLIMGNESVGTSTEADQLADAFYSIPKYGPAESLNVAVSFGIIMSQLVRAA